MRGTVHGFAHAVGLLENHLVRLQGHVVLLGAAAEQGPRLGIGGKLPL